MKFTVNSKILEKSLAKVIPGVPSKTMNPVMENFFLQVSDGTLFITSTNEEVFLQCNLSVQATEDFVFLTNAKLFYDLVRSIPDTTLYVEAVDQSKLQLKTDNGVYNLNYDVSQEFPQIPVVNREFEFQISGTLLKNIIEGTSFAIDKTNQTRMAITGMLFDFRSDALVFVGTDGHKLVRRTQFEFKSETPHQIVVPERTTSILSKVCDGHQVTLFNDASYVHFQMPDLYIVSKLVTMKYPNYQTVIPQENEKMLTVERKALLNAVTRMLLFSNPRFQQLRLSIKENAIELFSEDSNSHSSGLDTLESEYTGTPMDISFNPQFMQEILGHLTCEKVLFKLDTPTRAAILVPVVSEAEKEKEDILSLLMPVRLSTHS